MTELSDDFIKICAIIKAGGIMDLSTHKDIHKWNMDNPDNIVKIFAGIRNKVENEE